MVEYIKNIFRETARKHKLIKSFQCSRNHNIGEGNSQYPMLWLELPLYGKSNKGLITNDISFDVMLIPSEDLTPSQCQELAFSCGLNIIEYIKREFKKKGYEIPDWTYHTLEHYYDDNTFGCRFSLTLVLINMLDLCVVDEQFDENKEWEEKETMNKFDTNPNNACEVFTDKLPTFDLKLRK